jgi:hypothetical protein
MFWKLPETPDEWRGERFRSRFPALSIFKQDYSPKLCENDSAFLAPVGFFKSRQKCKKIRNFETT